MLIVLFHRKAIVVVDISVGVNNTSQMRKPGSSTGALVVRTWYFHRRSPGSTPGLGIEILHQAAAHHGQGLPKKKKKKKDDNHVRSLLGLPFEVRFSGLGSSKL